MGAIYAIINKENGRRYIGSTNNFYRRKREHLSTLRRGISGCKVLQRAWDKHGEGCFCFVLLEEVSDNEQLFVREQWWVDNTPCQYNMNKTDVRTCREVSEETKEKLRQAITGVKHPEWRRLQKSVSQGGKNHWSYGKPMREETRRKKSETMKDKYKTGFKSPVSKPVIQLDKEGNMVREYDSATKAARHLKVNVSAIQLVLYGKNKTCRGFKWKFKHEKTTEKNLQGDLLRGF